MTGARPAFIEPVHTRTPPRRAHTLRTGMTVSIALHIAAVAAFLFWKGMAPPARPPQYRIELIGAAGLKRQMGVVSDKQPVETAPKPAEAPKAAERAPDVEKKPAPAKTKAKPEPKPQKATPNQTKSKQPAAQPAEKTTAKPAPPVAGSGRSTGRGTDVTNMVVEGIQFPFPGYLDNIYRQVILAFNWARPGELVAEFRFVIHRDGSVTDIETLKSSGNRAFDLEGRGAIESVGNRRAFGSLPAGYSDDVLPVYFTFRPDKNLF